MQTKTMKRQLPLVGMIAGAIGATCIASAAEPGAPDVSFLVQSWHEADQATGWHATTLPQAGLRASAITLMPEGLPDDLAVFAPLRPTWSVWGEDPIASLKVSQKGALSWKREFAPLVQRYAGIGVKQVAVNVWMLTSTERFMHDHPAYADAVCLDLWGHRIVPPWVADADYQGAKTWWGCTNHPLFRELVRTRMEAGLKQGATLVHLDDHAGTYACTVSQAGCFCPWCMAGFRAWLQMRATPDQRARAEALGDLAHFDYRTVLRARGYAAQTAFLKATWAGEVPLWDLFRAFQRESAIAFIVELRADAARVAGRPVPLGVNAYNLLPHQLFDAHAVDYFANELEHVGVDPAVAPVAYRLAEALGRPAFMTGCGEDWITYNKTHCDVRVRTWIAQAYAFGQFFMYSWKKWGFSEETGTVWTQVEPGVFQPMTDFVNAHPALFDGHANVASVGLWYDNAAADAGHWGVRTVAGELLRHGVPFRLVPVGDNVLRRELSARDLANCRVVIVPSDVSVDGPAAVVLDAWRQSGGRVVQWDAATAEGDSALDPLPGRIEVRSSTPIWALPRATEDGALVVHLLNRDYDEAQDAMRRPGAFDLVLPRDGALPLPAEVRSARYHRPGEPTQDVAFDNGDADALVIHVPDLDIWGVVEIE